MSNSNQPIETNKPHAPDLLPPAVSATSQPANDPVLKPRAAALYLGLTVDWLATMRGTDKGPPYIRVGPRSCVYRKSALDTWRASRVDIKGTTVAPTTLPDESLPTSLTPTRT